MRDFVVNNPSELIVIIPDLEAITQFTSNSVILKEPRVGVFDKILNLV